jgi:hypothetical protein
VLKALEQVLRDPLSSSLLPPTPEPHHGLYNELANDFVQTRAASKVRSVLRGNKLTSLLRASNRL